MRGHRLLVTMASCVGAWQLCNQAAMVVQILFATRQLGLSERGVGLSYVTLGVGTVLASANGHRVVRRLGPGPTMVLGFAISGTGWLLLSLAPLNAFGVVAYALMLMMFGVGAVFIFINFLSLRQSVTPGTHARPHDEHHALAHFDSRGPGRLAGRLAGRTSGSAGRAGLCGQHGALLLALVAWRRPVIRSITTLPTLKAEAITPYSAD